MNWKTTVLGILTGLLQLAGQTFPKYKSIADAISALAIAALGVFAADAAKV